jgi:ornithine cyclodeaminase/alanine dehydrogenase
VRRLLSAASLGFKGGPRAPACDRSSGPATVTTYLTSSEVEEHLRVEDTLAAVELAHRALAAGDVVMALRTHTQVPGSNSVLEVITAAMPDALGLKAVTVFPDNPAVGLPRLASVIVLMNNEDGTCEAVLEADAITARRTAAASAVATKYLARTDAHVLGFLGAGVQARAHLDAIRAVRDIRRVVVWTRSEQTLATFLEHARRASVSVEACANTEEVVRAAEVLCTVTSSPTPLVERLWLSPGTHVNVVGDYREIDSQTLAAATVVLDSRRAALAECPIVAAALGDGSVTLEQLGLELGDIVSGSRVGRQSDSEITLFRSVGLAIQDLAVARQVLQRAQRP